MSRSGKSNTSKNLEINSIKKPSNKQDWLRTSGLITSVDLGLRSLEPRILLDAAGFVTGAEVAVDALQADDVSETMAATFDGEEEGVDNSVIENEALLSALEAAEDEVHEEDQTGDREVGSNVTPKPVPASNVDDGVFNTIKTAAPAVSLSDDGNFEVHSGETINVDLSTNYAGGGEFIGIIDPASPDVVITLTENETVELASGLGVSLLDDGTFDITGPSNPTERSVSFDYVVEDNEGEIITVTATFDWPVAPTIDLNGENTAGTNTIVLFDSAANTPVSLTTNDAFGLDLDGEEILSITIDVSGFDSNQERLILPNISGDQTYDFIPNISTPFNQGFFFDFDTSDTIQGLNFDAIVDWQNNQITITVQNGNAIPTASVNALLQQIQYQHDNATTATGNRTVSFTLNDGAENSNVATSTIIFDPTAAPSDLSLIHI